MSSDINFPALCRRCGLLVRVARPVCPSCKTELTPENLVAPPQTPPATTSAAVAGETDDGAKSLCALCMTAVNEGLLVEYEGQKICPACLETLKIKAKKQAEAPEAPQP